MQRVREFVFTLLNMAQVDSAVIKGTIVWLANRGDEYDF